MTCIHMLGGQYEGPDLTPLTYHLNNSETTCSERILHADFKSKEFFSTFSKLQKKEKN